MKFVEKIKNNWKKIVISAGILGCRILLGGYMCNMRKNLEKTEDNNNNNYNNNNYNYNNKHYKHNNNYKHKKK